MIQKYPECNPMSATGLYPLRRILPALIYMVMITGICKGDNVTYRQEEREFQKVSDDAAGDEALEGGVNPWKYWGEYPEDGASIRRPEWLHSDGIVHGWDWSLPPGTEPSARAIIRWGMHGWKRLERKSFPQKISVVDELWWRWRQVEPERGEYEFDGLYEAIQERLDAGCDGVIIRLLGSVWENGTPEDWKQWRKDGHLWRFNRWSAPRWLQDLGIRKIEEAKDDRRVVHTDIFDPTYHKHYLRLVEAFAASRIPDMPEVRALIICGMSVSNGEEAAGIKLDTPEKQKIWNERVRAWIRAFDGEKHRLIAMGDFASPAPDQQGSLRVGSRDGFVEMYLYHTNDPERGQRITADRYLAVDENNPYIRQEFIFGDENEEYRRGWADAPGRPGRFGPIESFPYRYFTSMLRLLQMRRNYLYTQEGSVIPELLWYVCHELGHTAEEAPDAWCFLRESHLSPWANKKPHQSPGRLKNFERWLYQRDRDGYRTEPAVRIPHAIKNWWLVDSEKRYDYVARQGAQIGFSIDEKFLAGTSSAAVKISYCDGFPGKWRLVYTQNGREMKSEPVETTGKDTFRTATFFIKADFNTNNKAFDLEIHSEMKVPISFVRVIKL